jgi:hypothetical protein
VAPVPRSFDFSIESPVSVEQFHSAFSEKDYWLAAFGGIGRLDSFVVDTDGLVTVVIKGGPEGRRAARARSERSLYPRSWQSVQKEAWSPIDVGKVRGEVSFASRGAPGSGLGAAIHAPTQNGSRLKGTATVEFKVPLIGGKIESIIGRQLVEDISSILRFTAKWITEQA